MIHYNTAHICMEGHCITSWGGNRVPADASFCTRCGSKIIASCPSCNAPIRGTAYDDEVLAVGNSNFVVPGYCHHCGAAYPWIQSRIDAIAEAAADDGSITAAETEKLLGFLPALASDTSRTKIGAVYVKRVMSSAGEMLKEALIDFAVKCTVEAAKSIILK